MAKKPPPVVVPKSLRDLPPTTVAKLAAEATVKLMLDGKKTDAAQVQAVWREARLENDPTQAQTFFRSILQGPEYKALLEIKMRRVTVADAEKVLPLKAISIAIAKLSSDGLLEDLIVRPYLVSPKDKQKMMTDALAIYDRLTPPDEGETGKPPSLEEAAAAQAAELERRLEGLPAELRERHVRQWKLESLRCIEQREKELLGDEPARQISAGVQQD